MGLVPTVLAYLRRLCGSCETGLLSGRSKDNLLAEVLGLLGAEEGGEGDGVYVSVGVVVRFVVAAWEYIAMGSQHAACPAKKILRSSFATDN